MASNMLDDAAGASLFCPDVGVATFCAFMAPFLPGIASSGGGKANKASSEKASWAPHASSQMATDFKLDIYVA